MLSQIWLTVSPALFVVNLYTHSSFAISLTVLIVGTLAGLYGYQGLGHMEGLLRQLLVGIPTAICFGLLTLLLEVQTGFAYSAALQEIIPILGGAAWHYLLFTTLGFISGLVEPVIDPNYFRIIQSQLTARRRWLVGTALALDLSLTLFAVIQVDFTKLHLLGDPQLSRATTIALAVCIGGTIAAFTLYINRILFWLSRHEIRSAVRRLGSVATAVVLAAVAGGGILLILAYPIIEQGWMILADIPFIGVTFVAMFRLQSLLDNDKDKQDRIFVGFSLAFFLVAVALQFYQLVAL